MAQRKVRVTLISEEEAEKPFRRHRITEKTAAKPYVPEEGHIPPFKKAIQTYAERRNYVCNPNQFYVWCLKKKIGPGDKDQHGKPLWMCLLAQWELRTKWGGTPSWYRGDFSTNRRSSGD